MLDEYPVYEHDIPRVNISAQKLEEWREVGHDEITRTLTHRNSWYFQFNEKTQDGYEQIADKDNLKAFARSVPNSQHKNVLIRASLETTLDAIVYGLYCETTYEQRCAFAHLYEDNFLDGAVLHVGKTKTREDPFRFVGMKWVAFRSPAPALVTSRDFIYFSYSGTMRDANGQRVLFRMLRSMPMDGVDVQERPNNNLVRGKISYLYLYRENGSRTEVSIQALHSTAGSMPSWAVTKTISFVWPGIFNLVTVAEAKVLMQNGMAGFHANAIFSSASSSGSSSHPGKSKSKSSSSAPANPSSCGVCFRRFRMMRSKRLCTGCHREMCKSCTTKLSFLDDRKQRSDTGVVPLRFCLNCMVKARTERVEITSHLLRDSVDIDLDDDFNALDISVYRETLKTKYLDADVLSDDDDDIDDIDDIDYIEPNFTSSRIKVHEDAGYSSGESYEGTSVMSSNLSFVSSMSSVDGSASITMPTNNLARPSSVPDLLRMNHQTGPRPRGALSSSDVAPDTRQLHSSVGPRPMPQALSDIQLSSSRGPPRPMQAASTASDIEFSSSRGSRQGLASSSSIPDLLQFNSSRGPRPGKHNFSSSRGVRSGSDHSSGAVPDLLQFNSGRGKKSNGFARLAVKPSAAPIPSQEVDDLEQTFRLRMVLFPNGDDGDALQNENRERNMASGVY